MLLGGHGLGLAVLLAGLSAILGLALRLVGVDAVLRIGPLGLARLGFLLRHASGRRALLGLVTDRRHELELLAPVVGRASEAAAGHAQGAVARSLARLGRLRVGRFAEHQGRQHAVDANALASDRSAGRPEAEVLHRAAADRGHGGPVVPRTALANALRAVASNDALREDHAALFLPVGEEDVVLAVHDARRQVPDALLALLLQLLGLPFRDEHLDVRPVQQGHSLQLAARVDARAELLGDLLADLDDLALLGLSADLEHGRECGDAVPLDLGHLSPLHRQGEQGVERVRGAGRHALATHQADGEPSRLLAHRGALGPLGAVAATEASAPNAARVGSAHRTLQICASPNLVDQKH